MTAVSPQEEAQAKTEVMGCCRVPSGPDPDQDRGSGHDRGESWLPCPLRTRPSPGQK
ncbi:hypothetical protein P7K49_014590 [Saguinus oedipus]|uniref:Uncharacterized protein n=1 Tax=Saguinus oedipus TaxID=9490 RepID=A0ABQ9V754_SAGOE|nr:hypothetical protein P7K49_014590 [Saguinus oedipus]